MAPAGVLRNFVTLSRSPQQSNDADGFFEALTPSSAWANIQPLAPGADGRTQTSLVMMRYHPQVSIDTRIVFKSRELFVKGVQNVNNHGVDLVLLCEEVIP